MARGTWNPLCGNHGSPGAFSHQGGGRLYYIVNRWKTHDGESRAGLMLGFNGHNAILEGRWGEPGGRDKVVWELFPADEWDPHTTIPKRVARGSFYPLRAAMGGNARQRQAYAVNRWKAHNGEHRAGRMLGFTGENAVLEGTWGRPGGRDMRAAALPQSDGGLQWETVWNAGRLIRFGAAMVRNVVPGRSARLGDLPVAPRRPPPMGTLM